MHWWAELWDNWAKTFGYDHWEWGSASDAFAAVGTVGALAVTLHIVRKDRRDKAEELARGMTGWNEVVGHVSFDDDGTEHASASISVGVHNSSSRPATVIRAYYIAGTVGMPIRPGNGVRRYETLLPSETAFFKTVVTGVQREDVTSVFMTFYDADGVHWTRNLMTQEIFKTRTTKAQRFWRRVRRQPGNALDRLKQKKE